MPSIEARLKDVLDETRLTMLGTQLLMGLQYRAAFTPGFARLPEAFRWLSGGALVLILTAAALLLATPAFHQLAEGGHASGRMLARASKFLKWSLAPLVVALAIDVALAFVSHAGLVGAMLAGGGFLVAAILMWFALPAYAARHDRGEEDMEDKQQSLEARIVQALTELRVILPGAQALFGFQVTAVLTDEFGRLPEASRYVHLASIAVVAVAVIMLIAPASYHRIAARGNAEEGVLNYAVRMMLPAEGLIAAGLVGDAYVTVGIISRNEAAAIGIAIAAFAVFGALLYVAPLLARGRRARGNGRGLPLPGHL
jgi:hypothetical protein